MSATNAIFVVRFNNGYVYKYAVGETICAEQLKEPHIAQ
jgi:hypothetical protein